ncbi:MAG: phospho-sugar mutase [Clostridia bacterium]|nr:phospho-sugar mutase [Clostridia bacterium]MDO5302951.1 phospho-sugar mutase [Clostridia bacterium]
MEKAIMTQIEKWKNSAVLTEAEKKELEAMTQEELASAFARDLEFGTAGLRGVMGLGTARMNIYVIRRATKGLAIYLKNHFQAPKVVISYDSRNHSREYAEAAAGVLAKAGVETYIYGEMMPVPVLSYTTRYLKCNAGIMITASHNPKQYNGYKVYAATGGQILDAAADEILGEIMSLDMFDDVDYYDFDEAMAKDCKYVPEEVYESFLAQAEAASKLTSERDLEIVYTPLNGSGARPVQDILARNGFNKVSVVKEQLEPNGDFPTCPSPNPEKVEVYELALELAKEKNADVIVATDPDCDRVGVMAKRGSQWVLMTGNQLGILLTDYIAGQVENPETKTMVTSVVSTPMVNKIAAAYGIGMRRTLVGFKYIGEQIDLLGDGFMFGFEESNGYLVGRYARDKDGVVAAKLACQMAAFYKAQGKTLIDVLDGLYEKFGHCVDQTVSVDLDDISQAKGIMEAIATRDAAEKVFGETSEFVNYSADETGLPKANMIQIEKEDGTRVIVRPSGTEPKVKLYMSFYEEDQEKLEERKTEILTNFKKII